MTDEIQIDPRKMASAAQKASELMKTLGHRDRLMVLCHLISGEKSVGELASLLENRGVTRRAQARPTEACQDYDRAVELFDKACDGTMNRDEGSPPMGESCFRVGDLYANGTGVERNLSRASFFFRRACRLGYQDACRRS